MNPIPGVGDHTESVLAGLGFDEAGRERLRQDGAI